jgi:hypothetical protein
MRTFSRSNSATRPYVAGRHHPGTVSPAVLRIAQEADATMSPDSWETAYYQPVLLAAVPAPNPALTPVKVLPTA